MPLLGYTLRNRITLWTWSFVAMVLSFRECLDVQLAELMPLAELRPPATILDNALFGSRRAQAARTSAGPRGRSPDCFRVSSRCLCAGNRSGCGQHRLPRHPNV